LVIPKGAYVDMTDFAQNASDAEIAALFRAVGKIAKEQNLTSSGYRILSNVGHNGGQEVPHLHIHLFGGQVLGPMLTRWGGQGGAVSC
jgi:diadenosine tetraphosphate (Ap4A) HIT family hydrolase